MKVYDELIQGTDEWFSVRSGKFTASKDFQQLVTGKTDTYRKLIRKKAAERITGQVVQSEYSNANMQRGNELEAQAIEAFELQTSKTIQKIGFVENSEWAGASPDGLIGDTEGIEIKCKDVHTHLDCFVDGYDTAYKWQIQGNLFITGRKSWYFASYNPYYAHVNKHLYIEKIQRDEVMIDKIEEKILQGTKDVLAMMKVIAPIK